MDYWAAFILGLIGSLHCAGMCGPLALALPMRRCAIRRFILGRFAYNLGRVVTYCLLGIVFGLVGKSLVLAGFQRWISLTLGVVLLLAWFGSRRFAWQRPVTNSVAWLRAQMSTWLRRSSLLSLMMLGLLNGLLPCGLVYVAGVGAAATGKIWNGLGYMAAFGLGTIPLMLAISLSGKVIPVSVRLKLTRAIPACIILLGMLLILRGLSLGIPYLSPDLTEGSCCGPGSRVEGRVEENR